MKNVHYNLLKCKEFIFHPFEFSGFKNPVNTPGGEIAWQLTCQFEESLKPNDTVLHPGDCKQNAANALAIFDETTIVAAKSYFPEEASAAAAFLTLFSKWWVLSNSKDRYSTVNYLGNAAVIGDNQASFLRAMADRIQDWQEKKVPNCEKFTLALRTASPFVIILKCYALVIEDLFAEGYDFIMTSSRFQSDPLKWRFGQ